MKSRRVLRILVGLVAFAAVVAGTYAVTLLSGPSPDEAMAEAIQRMEKLESYRFRMDGEMSVLGQSMDLTMEGAGTEGENPADSELEMEGSVDVLGQTMSISERVVDGRVYVKYDPDPTGAKPQWYYMPFDITGLESASSGNVNPADYLEYMKAFSNVEDKGTETLDGTECRHFYLEIDGEKLADIALEQYTAMLEDNPSLATDTIPEDEMRQLYEEMDISMDVYFGVDDGWPYREVIDMTFEAPVDPETGASVTLDMTITADFFDFNEPVDVQAPADAIPLPTQMGGTANEI